MAEFTLKNVTLKNGKAFHFRNLHPEDAEKLLVFRQQIASETTHTMQYAGMPMSTVEETQKHILIQQGDKRNLSLGAFDGDRLVGHLFFRIQWSDHPWVQHIGYFAMMILKDYWGYGIGKKLLEIQDQHATSVGVTRVEALVRTKNDRAIALYQKCGFKIEGTRKAAALINGELQDEFFIAKIFRDSASLWQPPVLTTERLIIRPIGVNDAESIFAYAKNPNVCRYTLWQSHKSVEDSLNYIKNYVFNFYSEGVPEPLGITLKDNPEKVIGTVGCFWVSKPSKSMELAYAIGEDYWGKGLVVEAAHALMEYCFKTFDLKRIQARCKKENTASARVMEKLGMNYEGTLKSSLFHQERFWDMVYYAKIKNI